MTMWHNIIRMRTKIAFTKHALNKINILKSHGFTLSKKKIIETLLAYDNLDKISDEPNLIVSKSFDDKHILRVVYKIEDDIIKIITFYPAEKGRYYQL